MPDRQWLSWMERRSHLGTSQFIQTINPLIKREDPKKGEMKAGQTTRTVIWPMAITLEAVGRGIAPHCPPFKIRNTDSRPSCPLCARILNPSPKSPCETRKKPSGSLFLHGLCAGTAGTKTHKRKISFHIYIKNILSLLSFDTFCFLNRWPLMFLTTDLLFSMTEWVTECVG